MRSIISGIIVAIVAGVLGFSEIAFAANNTLWKWSEGKTYDLEQVPTRYNYRIGRCKRDCSANFFTYTGKGQKGVFQLGVQFTHKSPGTERRVIVETTNGKVLIDEDWTERKNNNNPLYLSRRVGVEKKTNLRIHVIDKYDDVWSEMDEAYRIVTRFRETNDVEIEPNDSQETANEIALNQEMEGYYSPLDGGVDYYKFTADYTGWAVAQLTATVSESHASPYFEAKVIGFDEEGGAGWAGGTVDGDKEELNLGFTVFEGSTYYIKVTGRENNIIPMAPYKLIVYPNGGDLKDAKIYTENIKTFTGDAQKSMVTVNFKGMKLIWGTHFTVWYENNTQIGQGVIKIKGKNGFGGTIARTFTIKPKTPYLAMNTVPGKINLWWNKVYGGISGYQIAYAPTVDMKGEKRVALKADKLSAGLSLVRGKTYWFRIRAFKTVNGKIYYSDWSQPRGIKEK